jgi:hypothetical protein
MTFYIYNHAAIFWKSLDELFPLLFSNLEDSIPSIRQGGAVAIANVVRAYGG